ncbi:benzoate/H(+) symporter BenE family transporter [Eionea flava]
MSRRLSKLSSTLPHLSAGLATVMIGYTSSVAIVIQAATASGANAEQIISWLTALGFAMGLSTIVLSYCYKLPLLTAWSTPGAAMLIGIAADHTLSELTGAFIMTGLLVVLTGLIRPLSTLIARIPSPLATAMLGAIVLPFCIKAFMPLMDDTLLFAVLFATFVLCKRFFPSLTMSALLVVGIAYAVLSGQSINNIDISPLQWTSVMPEWNLSTIINVSIPLYLIAMLSQNLPGIAMLKSYGYPAPIKPVLIGTGATNMLLAPLGGFSLNLAAISAAVCMNEQVDADKNQRYKAAMWAGLFYLIAGCWAAAVVTLFLALPQALMAMLAGLALLGTLLMCMKTAFSDTPYQEAALITLVLGLSDITLLGLNSIMWGLLIGLGYFWATTYYRRQ